MLNCFFLYNYSLRLETEHFKQSPGDYLFLLIFNWLCCVIVGCIAEFAVRLQRIFKSFDLIRFLTFNTAADGSDDSVRAVRLVSTE